MSPADQQGSPVGAVPVQSDEPVDRHAIAPQSFTNKPPFH